MPSFAYGNLGTVKADNTNRFVHVLKQSFWISKVVKSESQSTSNHSPGARDAHPPSWPLSSSAWSGSGTTQNHPVAAQGFQQPEGLNQGKRKLQKPFYYELLTQPDRLLVRSRCKADIKITFTYNILSRDNKGFNTLLWAPLPSLRPYACFLMSGFSSMHWRSFPT